MTSNLQSGFSSTATQWAARTRAKRDAARLWPSSTVDTRPTPSGFAGAPPVSGSGYSDREGIRLQFKRRQWQMAVTEGQRPLPPEARLRRHFRSLLSCFQSCRRLIRPVWVGRSAWSRPTRSTISVNVRSGRKSGSCWPGRFLEIWMKRNWMAQHLVVGLSSKPDLNWFLECTMTDLRSFNSIQIMLKLEKTRIREVVCIFNRYLFFAAVQKWSAQVISRHS